MTIKTLSGLCGSGKTTHIIKDISQSKHPHHVICVPSIEMCSELHKKLDEVGVKSTVITSDHTTNTAHSAINALVQHSLSTDKHVVIITHATFAIMDISYMDGWFLWHDELPNLFNIISVYYDDHIKFEDYFDMDEDGVISLTELSESTKNHDGVNSDINSLIYGLKTGRFQSQLISHNKISSGKKHAIVINIITPDYFPSNTTLVSAGMEHSLLYKIFDQLEAVEPPKMLKSDNKNHESHEIEIVYAMSNLNSRYLRTQYQSEYNIAVDALCKLVRGDCIAVANRDTALPERFHRLNHNVHGVNKHKHVNNAMFLSSLNLQPEAMRILESSLGITAEDVYLDRTVSIAYQTVMRGSLRDTKDVEGFKIFVMEQRLAEELKRVYFPNATITGLEGYSVRLKKRGRPVKVDKTSNTDKIKASNIRKMATAGYYDKMTNVRVLSNPKTEAIMQLSIWTNTNSRGKLK